MNHLGLLHYISIIGLLLEKNQYQNTISIWNRGSQPFSVDEPPAKRENSWTPLVKLMKICYAYNISHVPQVGDPWSRLEMFQVPQLGNRFELSLSRISVFHHVNLFIYFLSSTLPDSILLFSNFLHRIPLFSTQVQLMGIKWGRTCKMSIRKLKKNLNNNVTHVPIKSNGSAQKKQAK
jgi:hypothetical protein